MTVQISGSTGIPVNATKFLVGLVAMFPCLNAPAGYIKLNGGLYSRSTYADLWAWIQTSGLLVASDGAWTSGKFSPGDGSTTFRVMDCRGEFLRCGDDGRGIDVGRVVGTTQAQQTRIRMSGDGVVVGGNLDYPGGAAQTSRFETNGQYGGVGSTEGNETRPRNVAMLACIFAGV